MQLEADLEVAISEFGIEVSGVHGIVARRGTYIRPVIKPDLVLPELRVAVELDNAADNPWRRNNHDTADGMADDRRRDSLLWDLGWRVLRVRRPDQTTFDDWPWRIETVSQSPKKVAALVLAQLELLASCPRPRTRPTTGRRQSPRSVTAQPL